MNDNIRQHLFLAALLHNIGVFYMYAEQEPEVKVSEGSPTNWTLKFLRLVGQKINSVSDLNVEKLRSILEPRTPNDDELRKIINTATKWSGKASSNSINCHLPLGSIFNRINDGSYQSYFLPHRLSTCGMTFIPASNINGFRDAIKELWKEFTSEFQNLPASSFMSFTESLIALLKKYTWCIPYSSEERTEISLYEHAKTTAAFSDCLYTFSLDTEDALKDIQSPCARPFLLVGGDISGIQKFIYNITSSKAAVSLKGRSFYLQLLVDTIIQKILSHRDISSMTAQVIYSSGGKFYMLLPNTGKVRNAIEDVKHKIDEYLWEEHYGNLSTGIAHIAFLPDDNGKAIYYGECHEKAEIGILWKSLADKLSACKNQKYITYIEAHFDSLFVPQNVSQKSVCAVTGIEGECVRNGEDDVLPSVMDQINLGKFLKDADYIISTEDPWPAALTHRKGLTILGTSVFLLTKDELEKLGNSISGSARIRKINSTDFLDLQFTGMDDSYSFQFYGGNRQAKAGRENKTFEQLANGEYLGVLRMDVDNLGAIFIKGLPERDKIFPAYATLSFLLDYFFSGYLNTIRKREEFRDDVNILYSGGDDVFAIGKWNKIILFAEAVRKDFAKFTGRDDMSISGGIAIVDGKFPIAKAAALAGEAEDQAKQFNNSEKNAITLFGECISWDKEYDYVKHHKEEFVSLVNKEKMPKSILQRIMVLNGKRKDGDPSYLWHTAYYMKRFAEGKDMQIGSFCKRICNDICTNERHYDLISIAARWAELETRVTTTTD